jgi:cytidylate kinase
MLVNEIIEGRFDPYQNKAIFFAGGAGSGKTYVARKLASVFYGLKQVNPDAALKIMMRRKGLDLAMPDREKSQREPMRQISKQIAGRQQQMYTKSGLGMLIDTTGRSYTRISDMKQELEQQGYDTAMIFVKADIETQMKRNRQRERQVPDDVIVKNFEQIRQNLGRYSRLFGENLFIIDNSESMMKQVDDQISKLESRLKKFLNA